MEMGEQKVESPAIITDQKTHEPFPAREFFCPSSFLIWRSLVREQIIAYPYSRKEDEMNQSYLCIDLKSYYASVGHLPLEGKAAIRESHLLKKGGEAAT